jgi:DinB superfamily
MTDHCDACGFTYDPDHAERAGPAIVARAGELADLLDPAPAAVRERSDPETWSALEYGCHMRDVLLTQRERVLAARRTDEPNPPPMGRDERVDHDGYTEQDPAAVARQLRDAAGLFANVLARLGPADWERGLVYNYPTRSVRSLRWVATHTEHEAVHHLGDARRQLPYRVTAFNTATASLNKIHDDAVAREYGFGGGLVPGVDVYAYLTHPPAAAWGLDWLARGTMRARFLTPVYDGEVIEVVAGTPVADPGGRAVMGLELRNLEGAVCAVGEAALPDGPPAPPEVAWPEAAAPSEERPADRPPASPASLATGTALTMPGHRFVADRAGEYLADVREGLPLYAEAGVAHPGWLLRDANYVLSSNVVLGPWIHVESLVQHHAVVRDGEVVDARAAVTREWEHKGHRFVALDVGLFADDRLAARVAHTAIYAPRRTR